MTSTTYRCTCGTLLRYRQDLEKESKAMSRVWKCRRCGTPVPGITAEKLQHQHPS